MLNETINLAFRNLYIILAGYEKNECHFIMFSILYTFNRYNGNFALLP